MRRIDEPSGKRFVCRRLWAKTAKQWGKVSSIVVGVSGGLAGLIGGSIYLEKGGARACTAAGGVAEGSGQNRKCRCTDGTLLPGEGSSDKWTPKACLEVMMKSGELSLEKLNKWLSSSNRPPLFATKEIEWGVRIQGLLGRFQALEARGPVNAKGDVDTEWIDAGASLANLRTEMKHVAEP